MPSPTTKTPDPTEVPAGYNDSPYKIACYKRGYMEGYGRGYQRAYDDFHSTSTGARKDKKTPSDKHHYPHVCKAGTERVCYDRGYEDGYVAGYASAEVDVDDA